VYILNGICKGLKEMKEKTNLAHRDIKPDNFILNEKGNNFFMTDFGLSKKQKIGEPEK
jgi:serine/threonine protein kinase